MVQDKLLSVRFTKNVFINQFIVVRGSKAIRYRPSSNHKRCQLAICRRFLCRLGRKLPGNQSIWVPGEVWLQS